MDLSEVARCKETLKNVTENAVDTEKNKILELIETVARKMSPQMQRFLKEGAEVLHEDSNSLDRLMLYMEDSLATLYAELDETNFQRILDAIWVELSIILLDLVQSNLEVSLRHLLLAIKIITLWIYLLSFLINRNAAPQVSSKILKKLLS